VVAGGAGLNVVVASSIARVTSHGITERTRKRGKGEGRPRIDFEWTGIRMGPTSFYRYSKLKFDLKVQGLSSPSFIPPPPLPSRISVRLL